MKKSASPKSPSRKLGSESLSEALGFSETVVEMGMTHPGARRIFERTGGICSLIVSLDDDRISAIEVELGQGHRGFEKEVESRSWEEAIPYVQRLGTGGGLAHAIGYCMAVERLADIGLPDRAIWLRTLACEVSRIFDHFLRLAAVAASTTLPSAEGIADQGAVCAGELMTKTLGLEKVDPWVVLGGVREGLPPDFDSLWAKVRVDLMDSLVAFERVGMRNPSFYRRLRGVGALGAESASLWGVTGPALRASGIPTDLRRDVPSLAYGSLDFDVAIGEHGDAFDRLLVVVAEIRQSISLIDQCAGWLRDLGSGATCSRDPNGVCSVPEGRAEGAIETSTGRLGFAVVSDGQGLPRRIRCRAPSFFHSQVLTSMLVGSPLDDLFPTVASLHLILAECDR